MNTLTYENLHEVKKHVSTQFPYNTYLCSIPLDFTQVPLHWHNDVEIIVIKKGCGIISVDTEPIDFHRKSHRRKRSDGFCKDKRGYSEGKDL